MGWLENLICTNRDRRLSRCTCMLLALTVGGCGRQPAASSGYSLAQLTSLVGISVPSSASNPEYAEKSVFVRWIYIGFDLPADAEAEFLRSNAMLFGATPFHFDDVIERDMRTCAVKVPWFSVPEVEQREHLAIEGKKNRGDVPLGWTQMVCKSRISNSLLRVLIVYSEETSR